MVLIPHLFSFLARCLSTIRTVLRVSRCNSESEVTRTLTSPTLTRVQTRVIVAASVRVRAN